MRKAQALGLSLLGVVLISGLVGCAYDSSGGRTPTDAEKAAALDLANEVLADCASSTDAVPKSEVMTGSFNECPFGNTVENVERWNVGQFTSDDCDWVYQRMKCALFDVELSLTTDSGTWGDASDFVRGYVMVDVAQDGTVSAWMQKLE